jgi:hypothetical protein
MRTRSTRDVFELWINYGQGWEYEVGEYSMSEARQRQREYRENCPEYPTKIKRTREPIQEPLQHAATV